MDKSSRKYLVMLGIMVVIAACYYGYKLLFAKKPEQPKMVVTLGKPVARRSAAQPTAAPPAAPGGKAAPASQAMAAAAPAVQEKTKPERNILEAGVKAFTYSSLGKRDPFMSVFEIPKLYPPVPANARPLERVPVKSLAVKAIVWNEKGYRAMVTTPDGRGYTVKVDDRIGDKMGRVTRITERSVYVTELIRDLLGDLETRVTVLKLHKEAE